MVPRVIQSSERAVGALVVAVLALLTYVMIRCLRLDSISLGYLESKPDSGYSQ